MAVARWATALLAIGATLLAGDVAVPIAKFRALEGSNVRITGRATLGPWECSTTEILAVIEPGAALAALSGRISGTAAASANCAAVTREPAAVPYANITIPVESLRTSKPGMRGDLLRALKHEEAPLIVFVLTALTGVEPLGRGDADLGRYRVTARGDLVLAGQLRSIEVVGTVVQQTPRHFRIEAAKDLRMSEFGIVPPTALFGAIRADDRIEIIFDLKFEAPATVPAMR